MSRSTFMAMATKRLTPLLCKSLALTAAVLLLGISAAYAAQGSAPADPLHPHRILDPKVSPNLTPEQRAQAQRNAAIQKRKDLQKFMKDVSEGKQSTTSGNTNGGGAK
jgi:hypothetical protein